MLKFSQRKGLTPLTSVIQTDQINESLRNGIWNVLLKHNVPDIFDSVEEIREVYWAEFLKRPMDEVPRTLSSYLRHTVMSDDWFRVYDTLELISREVDNYDLDQDLNKILERELSAYRLVGSLITEVTDQLEIESLEEGLLDSTYPTVQIHLRKSLELLSDRQNPDYRNSIKEAISAVESLAKQIAGKEKADLKQALSEIEKNGQLHKALKTAFLALYGYTSDADGIRHALMKESSLGADDAKFFLLACVSFINYLKTKIS